MEGEGGVMWREREEGCGGRERTDVEGGAVMWREGRSDVEGEGGVMWREREE